MADDNGDTPQPKPKRRGRPPKAKQTQLPIEGPGVAPKRIKRLEHLADIYAEKRDDRLAAGAEELKAKKDLIGAMHDHESDLGKDGNGVIRYEYDGGEKARRVVILKPTAEELKVKDVEAFEEVDVE